MPTLASLRAPTLALALMALASPIQAGPEDSSVPAMGSDDPRGSAVSQDVTGPPEHSLELTRVLGAVSEALRKLADARDSSRPTCGDRLWSLLPALIAAGVAIVVLRKQLQLSRLVNSVTLLDRLLDRFQSSLLTMRADAARDLLDPARKATSRPAADVLDFLTNVGFLVESNTLDIRSAYTFFEYYVLNYWSYCADLVAAERSKDPESWQTLEHFVEKLKKHSGKPGAFRIDPDFLALEASRTEPK